MGVAVLVYPIFVYFGIKYTEPKYIALVFLVVLVLRVIIPNPASRRIPWLMPATILGGIVLLSSVVLDNEWGLLLYPTVINLTLLAVFAWSLYKKPSVIETLARLSEPALSKAAVSYTEKVTLSWCIFFLCNTAISLYTVWLSDMAVWTIYNGFVAYILIGIFFLVELIIRRQVKKQHSNETS